MAKPLAKKSNRVSVRMDGREAEFMQKGADLAGVTVAEFIRRAVVNYAKSPLIRDAGKPEMPEFLVFDLLCHLHRLRNEAPTKPAITCYCGNLLGPHNQPGCGQPTTMWGEQAWEIEYLARRISEATWNQDGTLRRKHAHGRVEASS